MSDVVLRPRRRVASPWLVALFLLPIALLLVATRLLPLGVTLQQAATGGDGLWATVIGLFGSASFRSSVTTTLWFSLIINPLQVVCALGLAVLLNGRIPARSAWRTLVFLPVAVPPAVASIIWAIALRSPDGLVNGLLSTVGFKPVPFLISEDFALASIIMVASWVGVGYWMVFLIAGLQDVPEEVLEAAQVDGAGAWRRFWLITVPLLRRPLMFVLVADTVSNFLLFVQVQLLTNGGPNGATNLLMFEIYQQAFTFADTRTAAAGTLVLLAIMGVIVAVQAQLLKGGADE